MGERLLQPSKPAAVRLRENVRTTAESLADGFAQQKRSVGVRVGHTIFASALSLTDAYVHIRPNLDQFNYFPNRHRLPDMISSHAGNGILSIFPIAISGAVAAALEPKDKKMKNSSQARLIRAIPYIITTAVLVTNTISEWDYFKSWGQDLETRGDLITGLLAIVSATIICEMSYRVTKQLLNRPSKQIFPQAPDGGS